MSTSSKRYLSVAETAKLVRKALRADFPGTKFSVRSSSYAGGASIDVRWTDGPLEDQVQSTTALYRGATFDGMEDLKSYHDSLVMGENGPELVHFGADFIFGDRRTSPARLKVYEREVRRFVESIGETWCGLGASYPVSCYGRALGDQDHPGQLSHDRCSRETGHALIGRMGHFRPWHAELCPGGDGSYCPGCGRWQADHRAPHKR